MNKNAAVFLLCLLSAALGFGAGGTSASADEEAPSAAPAPAPEVGDAVPLEDASCGDYSCDAPEDCHSCAQDCEDCCGNGQCEPPEDHNSCPSDC